jgi:hypothetical protein
VAGQFPSSFIPGLLEARIATPLIARESEMDTSESIHDSGGAAAPEPVLPEFRSHTLRPKVRSLLFAFLAHHNPFYLLSALCMIAGCYALNGALDVRAGQLGRILILLGTINLYEVLLIALGLFLIRSRGIVRDGRTLLLLQAVFLVDLTFLSAETANADVRRGPWICLMLLALALVKVAVVLRVLNRRLPVKLFGIVAAQLAALYVIPCVFARFDRDGSITSRPFYMAWWIVGALAALPELQRWLPGERTPQNATRPRIGAAYAVAAFVSLLAHMGMLHWVYRVNFVPSDASPVLLGLALAANRAAPAGFLGLRDARLLRMALPAMAVMASLVGHDQAAPLFLLGRGGRFEITPLVLAFSGALLAYVYLFLLHLTPQILALAAVSAAIVLFGPTWGQVTSKTGDGFRWSIDLIGRTIPRTAAGWGVVAVSAAFAFLGIGAILSLSQGKAAEAPELDREAPT